MDNEYVLNWFSQFKKGIVPYLVLKQLRENEKYGYELLKSINNSYSLDITDGTLYPMLIRMYEANLLEFKWIEQNHGIPRKYYKMTQEGERVLMTMDEYYNKFSHLNKKS
ncbi:MULTISPECIES: PadR family transcriptional regulator [Sphingobacterium]|uniref:PadR family transcriptional regulator n=1 Tax=Sphingobacterium populi TaxID=1812824 RepID=A0ABW5UB90_9SPHI